jgi:hypothetical protein
MDKDELFSNGSLDGFLRDRLEVATSEIYKLDEIKEDADVHELVDKFCMKYRLECPTTLKDKIRHVINKKHNEPTITFFIPFDGDKELFTYRPSVFSQSRPKGNVKDTEIVFKISCEKSVTNLVKLFKENYELLKTNLQLVANKCEKFNSDLKIKCEKALVARKDELKRINDLERDLNTLTWQDEPKRE